METLLSARSKDNNIKGFINPDNTEIKTQGPADHTTVYVRDIESVGSTLTLIKYGLASESKLNIDMAQILLCGTSIPKIKSPEMQSLSIQLIK